VKPIDPRELLSWFEIYEKIGLIHDPIDNEKRNGDENNNIIEENGNTVTSIITQNNTHTELPFIIFDARRPDEYRQSHMHGAINVYHPRVLLRKRAREWMDQKIFACFNGPINKEITIVCYCAVGLRSGLLCQRLKRKGFKDVRILKGGYYGWANEGFPIYAKDTITHAVKAEHLLAGMILDGGLRRRAQEIKIEEIKENLGQK